jgi:hypothetical protein
VFERYRYSAQVGEYWVFTRLPDGAPAAGPWQRPADRTLGKPDPGLAGGSAPLSLAQVLAGVGFVGLVLLALRLEGRRAHA